MADEKGIQIELYNAQDKAYGEGQKRQLAVEAALKLIHAEALGGGASVNTLYSNMNELQRYADQIQKALEV
ncbi:MAG TPA: hypothetical protein VIM96_08020 [Pseudomonadales bacterium]|jgi:hypothetical protein